MTIVLNTPVQIQAYRAAVIKHALKIYANTGMQVNRAYTPTAMLKAAGQLTGKTYKRGQYLLAADDLQSLLEA